MRSKILGTGSYVPEEILTNKQIEKIVDTTDKWILERTGISERRVAAKGVGVSELSLPAAENAIKAAGINASEIDLIIFSTITPDSMCPSAACWLQANLDIGNCPAFDLNAACSGFVYGLQCSDAYIRSGLAKKVLLVGGDIMTRVADWTDRGNCILWGDGAGAVVVGQSEDDSGIIDSITYSDGREGELILIVGGGSKLTPISEEDVKSNAHLLKMNGREGSMLFTASGSPVEFKDLPSWLQKDITTRLPLYRHAPRCMLDLPDSTSWSYFGEHFQEYLNGEQFPAPVSTQPPCKK